MKLFEVMGFQNIEDCIRYNEDYMIKELENSNYVIDELDGITFVYGSKVEKELKNRQIMLGAAFPTGDISISMEDCQIVSKMTGIPLNKVVGFAVHHEAWHVQNDFNGGYTIEESLGMDIEEFNTPQESEVNADMHSILVNNLTKNEYRQIRLALEEMVGVIDSKYKNLPNKVLNMLEEANYAA